MVLTSSCSACSECCVVSDACFCFRWVYHKYKDHLLLADQDILNVLFGISPWYVLWCIKNTVMNWMNRRDLQTKTWQTTVTFLEVWRGHLLTGSIVFHLDKYQDHTKSPSPDVRMPPILQGSTATINIRSGLVKKLSVVSVQKILRSHGGFSGRFLLAVLSNFISPSWDYLAMRQILFLQDLARETSCRQR